MIASWPGGEPGVMLMIAGRMTKAAALDWAITFGGVGRRGEPGRELSQLHHVDAGVQAGRERHDELAGGRCRAATDPTRVPVTPGVVKVTASAGSRLLPIRGDLGRRRRGQVDGLRQDRINRRQGERDGQHPPLEHRQRRARRLVIGLDQDGTGHVGHRQNVVHVGKRHPKLVHVFQG